MADLTTLLSKFLQELYAGVFGTVSTISALVLGGASTSGVRLDLESGDLAIREGDDSGYANVKAGTIEASGNITGSTLVAGAAQSFTWSGRSRLNSAADGNVRVLNTAQTNTFDITLTDARALLSGEAVSYIADATGNLGTPIGLLIVTLGTENKTGVYVLSETATTELSDPGNIFTVTKDNANTINIYWDTNAFFIQNKIAGTRAIRAVLIGG